MTDNRRLSEYNLRDMTPEMASSAEPAPQGMSGFARIVGVFFEPGKTFEDIGKRPTWFLPLLIIVLSTITFTTLLGQHVGWDHIVRQQVENSSRAAQLTAEQREAQIAVGARMAPIFGFATVVIIPLSYVIISGILLAMTAMMSGGLKFKQVFAAVCHSGLSGVVYAVLGIAVMFMKKPEDFNVNNPLMFNVGAFMDPQGASKFIYSLATSIDLFSFWMIFLIATGLNGAAGKRLSFGGAMTAVVVPWAIYVFGKSALAGIFS
jgi:hypothetical protein